MSHDLRTPINLVRGYAEGLRDGVASTPQMRERYLATILEESGELERLIELLFAYSTMDLEGARPKLAPVSVAPFLEALRGSLAAAFPSARISLVLPERQADHDQQSRALSIIADAEMTRRVMSNLVDNAVKHGGRTPIAVQWQVARAASTAPARRFVQVVVSDDGVGVAAEDLSRIFEPFFRADRARQNRASGAGLGLSIVRKIMEGQGGSVGAASGPHGGLEITLLFPEAPEGQDSVEAENGGEGQDSVEADPDR